jgi:ribose transport system permease protein
VTAAPVARPTTDAGLAVVTQRLRRNGWTIALIALLGGLLALARWIRVDYGATDLQALTSAVLPVAFATAAQTVVVISGGIDLSIG